MSNRIVKSVVRVRRFDPVEAELTMDVHCERVTAATAVKCQLTGPRCPYATTVEIAYSFRELSRTDCPHEPPQVRLRAIIPEPSPWDPVSPFLYEGFVELWEDGSRCDQKRIRQGIRTVRFGPKGWRWNGLELAFRGQPCQELTEDEARRLHEDGCNLLLVPVAENAQKTWEVADRFGLLLLGHIESAEALTLAEQLANATCVLGWVVNPVLLTSQTSIPQALHPLGVDVTEPGSPIPAAASFLVVAHGMAREYQTVDLPKVNIGES